MRQHAEASHRGLGTIRASLRRARPPAVRERVRGAKERLSEVSFGLAAVCSSNKYAIRTIQCVSTNGQVWSCPNCGGEVESVASSALLESGCKVVEDVEFDAVLASPYFGFGCESANGEEHRALLFRPRNPVKPLNVGAPHSRLGVFDLCDRSFRLDVDSAIRAGWCSAGIGGGHLESCIA